MGNLIEETKLLRRRDQAIRYFRKKFRGLDDFHAQEFGNYCVVAWISGKRPFEGTKLEFLALDYYRERITAINQRGSTDVMVRFEDAGQTVFESMCEPREPIKNLENVMLTFDHPMINQIERAVLVLYYVWGLTLKEIGFVFNLTDGRIIALRDQATDKISNSLREERLKRSRFSFRQEDPGTH